MRALLTLLVVGCFSFASGCGEKGDGDGGSGGQSSGGADPADGDTGGSSTGGGTGGSTGGGTTGGSGGSTSGGAAGAGGAPPNGSGGAADPYAGYPDWVEECGASRNLAQCPSCLTPECIVCTYGTDDEIEDTESTCNESPDTYAFYCDCAGCNNSMGGACRYP